MGERIGRIGRIRTDFLGTNARISSKKSKKKSVRIRPIRPIRSPIVSPPSKAEIANDSNSTNYHHNFIPPQKKFKKNYFFFQLWELF
jgi:hypothetical protein